MIFTMVWKSTNRTRSDDEAQPLHFAMLKAHSLS